MKWNGADVGWYAEWDCVISCAYSLTYDFHMEQGMEWNKEWNGTRNGMVHFCMEWNEKKNLKWNGTDVGWYAEWDCVISCAYSLTYDFHMGRVEPRGGGGGRVLSFYLHT